jgi:signal transduction histidine kinase
MAVVIIGVTLGVIVLNSPVFAQEKALKILFLHSYDSQNVWTRDISAGFFETIEPYRSFVDVYEEFMDTKRMHSQADYLNFSRYIETKYEGTEFSLIVAADNNALNFVKESELEILSEVPVVFVGINPDDSNIALPQRFAGVYEKVDIEKTLDLISTIHPDESKILVVTGDSVTSQAVMSQVRESIKAFKGKQALELVESSNLDFIEQKLNELNRYDAVLMVLFSADDAGNHYSYNEGLEAIYDMSKSPIYGMWKFYLGNGIIGGYLVDGYEHGQVAADFAISKLQGESYDYDQLEIAKPDLYFDYKELKQFGLESISLPNEAVIINKPTDRMREYAPLILGTAISAALITLIMALAYLNRKEHMMNENLEAEKIRLETLFDHDKAFMLNGAGVLDPKIELLQQECSRVVEENKQLRHKLTKQNANANDPLQVPLEMYPKLVQLDLAARLNRILFKNSLRESLHIKSFLTEVEFAQDRTEQIRTLYQDGEMKRSDFEQYIESRLRTTEKLNAHLNTFLEETRQMYGTEIISLNEGTQMSDPTKVIKDAAELAFLENSSQQVKLELELDQNLPYIQRTHYLKYMILQLVSNALYHGIEGRGGVVNIKAALEKDKIMVIVSDDGCGMDKTCLEKSETLFYTCQPDSHFSGIGLSVVRYVAEHIFEGSLSIYSEVGTGTDVVIEIPLGGAVHV